jgi:Protein of unknown function (DUF998)
MTEQTTAARPQDRARPSVGPAAPGSPARRTRTLLACGAVAGPLFVAVGVAQALTRPGFDLTRNALSLLDDGSLGWIQSANFIVAGLLFIAAAAAMRHALRPGPGSRWAPRLLTITGAGFIGGGIFHPDPSGGFPPGTPPGASAISSWHGALHEVSGSAAFLALIVFCVVLARRYRAGGEWVLAACSLAAGVLCLAGVASGGAPHGSLTLFTGVSIALLWAAFAAARLARGNARPGHPSA